MNEKHVLITGHTGFKGSWLVAMLQSKGATVSGLSLDPIKGGIFEAARISELLENDIRSDIRNANELIRHFQSIEPDIVIHMAAQPLVLTSYKNPMETYESNVTGTFNVLQAVKATPSIEATLVITTDKVYQQGRIDQRAFIETDPLGAADPYSTSKAMADLLTQSWIKSNPDSKIAIARAGNVIGGGDSGVNRLLPDLIYAFENGKSAEIRNPKAVRPWQHVLDCLEGYTRLANALWNGELNSGVYNFGPDPKNSVSVEEVAKLAAKSWGPDAVWRIGEHASLPEAMHLQLSSEKAKQHLGWSTVLTTKEAIDWTIEWHKNSSQGQSCHQLVSQQISKFSLLQPPLGPL